MKHENHTAQDGELSRIPCGLYQTTQEVPGHVPEGSLVYYHNHGNPGPGVYLVERWENNKAVFREKGVLVPEETFAFSLKPLKPEGLYRVREPFHCCDKRCRLFEQDTIVQLGYSARAEPLLFVLRWSAQGLELPDQGTRIDEERLSHLAPLKLEGRFDAPPEGERDKPFFMGRGSDLAH
jgi:hypothetical protein